MQQELQILSHLNETRRPANIAWVSVNMQTISRVQANLTKLVFLEAPYKEYTAKDYKI